MKRTEFRTIGLGLTMAASLVSFRAVATEGPYVGIQLGANLAGKQNYLLKGQSTTMTQAPDGTEAPLEQNSGESAGVYKYNINPLAQIVLGDTLKYKPFGLFSFRPEFELGLRREEPKSITYYDGSTGAKTGVQLSSTTGIANLWIDFFPSSSIHPYFGAGAGAIQLILNNGQFDPPPQTPTNFTVPASRKADDTTVIFQGGAGVNWDVYGPFTVGVDYRYVRSLRADLYPYKDQPLTFVSTSYKAQSLLLSLHYYFARPVTPAPIVPPPTEVIPVAQPVDTDGDGVPDDVDQCPDTPHGTKVDVKGCPLPPPCKTPEPGEKISLAGCGTGDSIVLNGVNFDNDKATLTPNAKSILDNVASELKQYPDIQVEVQGHTDSNASVQHNQGLSERRAASVKKYLVDAGVDAGRMTTIGFGESQPIADNGTAEGRALNRRVQLRITQGSITQGGPGSEGSSEASPAPEAAAPAPSAEAPTAPQ